MGIGGMTKEDNEAGGQNAIIYTKATRLIYYEVDVVFPNWSLVATFSSTNRKSRGVRPKGGARSGAVQIAADGRGLGRAGLPGH